MESLNLNIYKNNENEETEEFFYGNNYINNLKNILFSRTKDNNNIIANNKNNQKNYDELISNLNIICKIFPESITPLFSIESKNNYLYNDKIGQIDFNSVIIRKYNPHPCTNLSFYNTYFKILSKVVYPTIQIFYGILNKPMENNFEIILEYIPSSFEEVQSFITKCINGIKINYLISVKISEVLSFIYECGYPFLMLYPNNIKFNNKLFKQYFKVTEDSDYLYAINKDYFSNPSKIFNNNFMKILNIGTYLKYQLDKKFYSISNEYLNNICYFSPEFIKFLLDENIKSLPDDLTILEKWDIYSFGCILFYIFFQKDPYFFIINDTKITEENKFKKLIDAKLKEKNFLELNMNYIKDKICSIPDDIINLIKICTSNQIELRPSFNEIFEKLNSIIKTLLNDNINNSSSTKDLYHDYSFYQLSKYNDDLIIKKEILKNNKLKDELTYLKKSFFGK